MFSDDELSQDQFLGGALTVLQPKSGYRAGVDPVLLAASVPAKSGEAVLELGCGVGVASLCLAARVSELSMVGVELQPDYAELARRNADRNHTDLTIKTADLRELPADLRSKSFNHVIANPPYYQRSKGTAANDPCRDIALAGETPLSDWVDIAARRLKPKGWLSVIQDIRRLPELLGAVEGRLGSIEILPLSARETRAPHLFILRARKGGRAPFLQHFPRVMHQGVQHDGDRPDYTPEIEQILRHGAALEF